MNKNLLAPFREELIKYCKANGLLYEKIIALPKCGNDNILAVQYYDSKDCGRGLLNNEPAEIVIMAKRLSNGKVEITPGKNMSKYLI